MIYLREQAEGVIRSAEAMRAATRRVCARRGIECLPEYLEPYDREEAKARTKLEEWECN